MEERPLHAAVLGGHAGVVQILVEQKADINAASKNGFLTPSSQPSGASSEDVAEYLLEHGANARALCGARLRRSGRGRAGSMIWQACFSARRGGRT